MPHAIDLTLYLVLDPVLTAGYGMVETALAAARNGATVVQLRAPDWKKRQYYECAAALKAALAPYPTALIINDHVDVALAIDADGVHIGQKDLPVEVTRKLIGPEKILGLSISSLKEVQAMDATLLDYIGIGPVFATATKKDAAPAVGIEGFEMICAASPLPAVAIGSVKTQHIEALKRAGANGIAVVSAICGQKDPAAATQALLAAWQRAQ